MMMLAAGRNERFNVGDTTKIDIGPAVIARIERQSFHRRQALGLFTQGL